MTDKAFVHYNKIVGLSGWLQCWISQSRWSTSTPMTRTVTIMLRRGRRWLMLNLLPSLMTTTLWMMLWSVPRSCLAPLPSLLFLGDYYCLLKSVQLFFLSKLLVARIMKIGDESLLALSPTFVICVCNATKSWNFGWSQLRGVQKSSGARGGGGLRTDGGSGSASVVVKLESMMYGHNRQPATQACFSSHLLCINTTSDLTGKY